MASALSKQIESEFAKLPPDEQLSLLERLMGDFRVGGWGRRGLSAKPGPTPASNSDVARQLGAVRPDAAAGRGDMLSEGF